MGNSSLDRLKRFLLEEIRRLDDESDCIRQEADAASFDDLKAGLSQRAEDLAEEAQELRSILERLPSSRGDRRNRPEAAI